MKTLKPFGTANPHMGSVRPSTDGHYRIRWKTAIGPTQERTSNPLSGLLKTSLHLLAVGFLFCLLQTNVAAAVFVVTNAVDTVPASPGSLRQALANAAGSAGADTITFDPSVFTPAAHTITLAGELVISDAGGVTMDATALAYGVTITGGNAKRLVSVAAGGNLTLRGLTLIGGNGSGTTLSGTGGALYNAGAVTV